MDAVKILEKLIAAIEHFQYRWAIRLEGIIDRLYTWKSDILSVWKRGRQRLKVNNIYSI